eukprot:6211448-Pleurochrysis_carterae.AAC.1
MAGRGLCVFCEWFTCSATCRADAPYELQKPCQSFALPARFFAAGFDFAPTRRARSERACRCAAM